MQETLQETHGRTRTLPAESHRPRLFVAGDRLEQASRLTRGFENGRLAHASASSLVSRSNEFLVRRDRRPAATPRQAPCRPAAAPQAETGRSTAPAAAGDRAGIPPPDGD